MTWSLSFSDTVRDGDILRRFDMMPQLYPIGSLPHSLHLSISSDWTLAHLHTPDLPQVRVIFPSFLFSFRRLRHRSSWLFVSALRAFNFLLVSSITYATIRCERTTQTSVPASLIGEGWILNNPGLSFSIFPFIMAAWSLNVLCWFTCCKVRSMVDIDYPSEFPPFFRFLSVVFWSTISFIIFLFQRPV